MFIIHYLSICILPYPCDLSIGRMYLLESDRISQQQYSSSCYFAIAHPLGQLKNFLVLLSFCRSLRRSNKIVWQSLFLAIVRDLNLWFACHCPGCVKDRITIFINYRGFGATEVIFQIQRYATIFKWPLFQFGVVFVLFCGFAIFLIRL